MMREQIADVLATLLASGETDLPVDLEVTSEENGYDYSEIGLDIEGVEYTITIEENYR